MVYFDAFVRLLRRREAPSYELHRLRLFLEDFALDSRVYCGYDLQQHYATGKVALTHKNACQAWELERDLLDIDQAIVPFLSEDGVAETHAFFHRTAVPKPELAFTATSRDVKNKERQLSELIRLVRGNSRTRLHKGEARHRQGHNECSSRPQIAGERGAEFRRMFQKL